MSHLQMSHKYGGERKERNGVIRMNVSDMVEGNTVMGEASVLSAVRLVSVLSDCVSSIILDLDTVPLLPAVSLRLKSEIGSEPSWYLVKGQKAPNNHPR